jgi:hypothetical protein
MADEPKDESKMIELLKRWADEAVNDAIGRPERIGEALKMLRNLQVRKTSVQEGTRIRLSDD